MAVLASLICVPGAGAQVLRVGSYSGVPGQYATIQAAVDAAGPRDWVLVGPGDYKTSSIRSMSASGETFPAAVLVTTSRSRTSPPATS